MTFYVEIDGFVEGHSKAFENLPGMTALYIGGRTKADGRPPMHAFVPLSKGRAYIKANAKEC